MFKTKSLEPFNYKCKSRPNIDVKILSEKHYECNKYRNVKLQTDPVDLHCEIAELLSEISTLVEGKLKLESELSSAKKTLVKNEDEHRIEKIQNESEIIKLKEDNLELRSVISKIKIEHLEDNHKLLSQVTFILCKLSTILKFVMTKCNYFIVLFFK